RIKRAECEELKSSHSARLPLGKLKGQSEKKSKKAAALDFPFRVYSEISRKVRSSAESNSVGLPL
ncbi:MAG: hypothetical protein PF487_07690, partial [Bacteroidales bacterium]|nr:hypothetical protein [Bacteroidales bacterium]